MFIKKYLQFINESRSKIIDSNKNYIDVIKEYAPWYMENDMSGLQLYRGLQRHDDFLLVDPRGSNRKPVGSNSPYGQLPIYYNLIMEESNRWKKFSGDIPRSESIFTTNSEMSADKFGIDKDGSTYVVIPLERDTEFIMGFTTDAYGSFTYINKRFGIDMTYFSEGLMRYLGLKTWDYNSLAEMRKEVESIFNNNHKFTDNNGNEMTHAEEFMKWLNERNFNTSRPHEDRITKEEIEKEGGFMNWIEKMFDPELNQFERVKYNHNIDFKRKNKYNGKEYSQFELWTNKPCLLVNNKFFDVWKY